MSTVVGLQFICLFCRYLLDYIRFFWVENLEVNWVIMIKIDLYSWLMFFRLHDSSMIVYHFNMVKRLYPVFISLKLLHDFNFWWYLNLYDHIQWYCVLLGLKNQFKHVTMLFFFCFCFSSSFFVYMIRFAFIITVR